MRIYNLILGTMIKPEAMEMLLQYSSKWKHHSNESNNALRKMLGKPI